MTDEVAVLRGRDVEGMIAGPIVSFAANFWDLDHVAAKYTHFIEHFRPVLPLLAEPPDAAGRFCAAGHC